MKSLLRVISLTILVLVFGMQCSLSEKITLSVRSREQDPNDSNSYLVKKKKLMLSPNELAIILCDLWDSDSPSKFAISTNEVVKIARDKGVFIIHAPSETMDYYKDTPQRKRALDAPYAQAPNIIRRRVEESEYEPPLPGTFQHIRSGFDEKNLYVNTSLSKKTWTKQNDAIEIAPEDAISDNGQEIYNLLEQHSIDNVVIIGGATDICIVRRSFGIRQMVYNGKNIMLCRDLTSVGGSHTETRSKAYQQIIEHIEKYWCPSITSQSITGNPPYQL